MVMMVVMVMSVHLLVHVLHITTGSVVRLAVGVVDDVVFSQVVEDGAVFFFINLFVAHLVHFARCGEMLECYPNIGPLVFRCLVRVCFCHFFYSKY